MSARLAVRCPGCHAVLPEDHPYGWCPTCGVKLPYEVLRALGHPAVTPPGTAGGAGSPAGGHTLAGGAPRRGSPSAEGENRLVHDLQAQPEVDVLIVEDHAPVRSVMGHILNEAGYTFHAVENGLAALAAVQECRYRAIICDLGMPMVGGVRFYEDVASGDPALAKRVLFVSAMSRAPAIEAFLKRTGRPVLQKPFEMRALVRAVAQLVDRPPRPGALL